ncbi:hypothetical protein Tco_0519679 [Tanacetum coccineum]
MRGASCGTKGDRIVDRLSDVCSRAGPAESAFGLIIRIVVLLIVRNPWSSLTTRVVGSFGVIVGMDRLSKRKFMIVCHENVVRIPLEGDEILRVHGKRTQGVVKTLMNTKVRCYGHDIGLLQVRRPVKNTSREMLVDLDQPMEKELVDDGCTLWIKLYSKYEYEIRYHPGRTNVVIDALRKKEQVKPRRVRAMAMTIQYGVRGMILAAQSEAFKQENVLAERLHGLD